MDLKLRHLRYFVTVVDSGSFSRAASTIHIAQPALSRQVLEIEEMLGVELLHRTARGVRPTVAGEALYREATLILRQMEKIPEIVRSVGGEIEGIVSIGMSSTLASYLSGALMDACHAEFPKIKLRLITADSIVLKSRLDAGQLDLAVVFEDQPSPGYVRRPLFRQQLYLVHRERSDSVDAPIRLENLAQLPLVLPALPNVTRILLDRVFESNGIDPNMVGEADVLSSMLSAVHSGLGHTIVPKGDLSDVPGYGSLYAQPIEPAIFLTAAVVMSNERPMSRAALFVLGVLTRIILRLMTETPPPGAQWIGDDTSTKTRAQ